MCGAYQDSEFKHQVTVEIRDVWYTVTCLIHPASRGGPPTPQVFWFSPCKDIEHASIFFAAFLDCFPSTPT